MNAVLPQPKSVSRDEWLTARLDLLARERELTRMRDAVAAQRRALPWVRVETPYVFQTIDGPKRLGALFAGKSQLAIYHFMLAPGDAAPCHGCAFLADHVDGARQHFENADLAFVAVSRAPLDDILEVRWRMGWRFPWVSSEGGSFNADFGVYYTAEQAAAGEALYNYGTSPGWAGDAHGVSIFARDETGQVFHTYSTYARGAESLLGAMNWLDLALRGETSTGP
ncbi:DUF899 domain-containing protein [Phenylobacterium deserti]|uniref:DUF899 domain-containing protein n=1 Tax=Phenylobacterium deserti TaxID=1914756 RepID=UPI001F0C0929|nr:DUF899 family protein [Phenylobacterium deserti]